MISSTPNKIRVVLVEADAYSVGSVITRYLSNYPYISGPSDSPANISYEDIVSSIPQFSTRMSEQFTGQSSPSWGDIEIRNVNGEYDSWLNDGWDGRALLIYFGDLSWSRNDYRLIVSGRTADIYAKDQSTLALKIRDKQWMLNVPAQTNLIGGTTANKDQPKPLCYGPCKNIEPVLIDAALHKYQVHDGPVNAITAVYDDGVSVSFTADLTTGTFVLTSAPSGRITADVQGAKPSGTYLTKCAEIMQHLITTHSLLTAGDLDSASFNTLNTVAPQTLNLFVRERENLIPVLDSLITSVGGWYGNSRDGLLQVGRLQVPTGDPVLTLTADDLQEGTLRTGRRILPLTTVRLGYARNWTVQTDGLAGAVTEARRAELATEYLVAKAIDASVKAPHLLAAEPDLQGTLIALQADADTEAARRLALYGVLRNTFHLDTFSAPFRVNLGATAHLTHPRFGFSAGVKVVVVGMTEYPTKNRMSLEVWR